MREELHEQRMTSSRHTTMLGGYWSEPLDGATESKGEASLGIMQALELNTPPQPKWAREWIHTTTSRRQPRQFGRSIVPLSMWQVQTLPIVGRFAPLQREGRRAAGTTRRRDQRHFIAKSRSWTQNTYKAQQIMREQPRKFLRVPGTYGSSSAGWRRQPRPSERTHRPRTRATGASSSMSSTSASMHGRRSAPAWLKRPSAHETMPSKPDERHACPRLISPSAHGSSVAHHGDV